MMVEIVKCHTIKVGFPDGTSGHFTMYRTKKICDIDDDDMFHCMFFEPKVVKLAAFKSPVGL